MSDFVIVLPAAGASSRMQGRDKLLEVVDEVPLLRRQVMAALALGAPVAVTLDPARERRAEVLLGLEVTHLEVPDAEVGISASLRAASEWAEARGLMILLPDVPGVGPTEVSQVADGWTGQTLHRATDPDGRPGTPFLIPASAHPRLRNLKGDHGGRALFKDMTLEWVSFPDRRATRDLDTPEDWDAWRAARTR